MKIIYVALCCMGLSTAFNDARAGDLCRTLGVSAEKTMRARQMGANMADLMDMVPKDQSVEKVLKSIIIQAYQRARYDTEEFQRKAIVDFSNEIQVSCYASPQ